MSASCLVPFSMSCNATLLLPPKVACAHPCSWNGGIESPMFVHKISDTTRCPCAHVPLTAFAVDGGASSDASDALGWARARDQWNIVAFEPLPRNCLRSARVLSPFAPRVRLVCSALSNVKGPAVFDDQGESDSMGSLSAGAANADGVWNRSISVIVNTTTLDDVMSGSTGSIFLLKLDLQGAEVLALRGAAKLLHEQRISWIFCEFDPFILQLSGTSAHLLLDLLASHGFSCHNFRGRSWRPWNYYRRSDGSTNYWTNLICGHNSVARWVGGDWRRELLSEYCKEQRCTININQNHTIGAMKARRGHGRGELVCRDVCG